MVESVRRSATWTRSGTPEEALNAIEAYARSRKGRIKKKDEQITLYFGSRLMYRLMGVSTARTPYTTALKYLNLWPLVSDF
jgi:hypothetical protein